MTNDLLEKFEELKQTLAEKEATFNKINEFIDSIDLSGDFDIYQCETDICEKLYYDLSEIEDYIYQDLNSDIYCSNTTDYIVQDYYNSIAEEFCDSVKEFEYSDYDFRTIKKYIEQLEYYINYHENTCDSFGDIIFDYFCNNWNEYYDMIAEDMYAYAEDIKNDFEDLKNNKITKESFISGLECDFSENWFKYLGIDQQEEIMNNCEFSKELVEFIEREVIK